MKTRLLVFALALVAGLAHAQTADEILAKYFESTGGIEKWRALNSMIGTGKMSMQGMELDFSLTMKKPNKQFMKISIQGQDIITAYDGTDAWMLNPFQGGKDPVKLPPDQAKEMTEEELEDDFIDYKKKGHEVKLLGKEEIDGTQCYKIELVKNKNNDKEDVTQIYYFDAENYVPIVTASFVRSGPAKGQETRTYMSDYQDVKGIMMPFSMETKLNGQTVQKMTFSKMEVNSDVSDAMFAFPKK
ncbi:MAG: outer membrane lipoprotein-sorting protein [Cyclobacteriaceae bacterium]|jgi:outer membrane lipoprotein-sorting protein